MDPDAALNRLRELSGEVDGLPEPSGGDGGPNSLDLLVEMDGVVQDLDGWLRGGGFLPSEWDTSKQRCKWLLINSIGGDLGHVLNGTVPFVGTAEELAAHASENLSLAVTKVRDDVVICWWPGGNRLRVFLADRRKED